MDDSVEKVDHQLFKSFVISSMKFNYLKLFFSTSSHSISLFHWFYPHLVISTFLFSCNNLCASHNHIGTVFSLAHYFLMLLMLSFSLNTFALCHISTLTFYILQSMLVSFLSNLCMFLCSQLKFHHYVALLFIHKHHTICLSLWEKYFFLPTE